MLSSRLAPTLLPSRLGVLPRTPSCLSLVRRANAGRVARGPGPGLEGGGGGDGRAASSSSSSTRWKTRQGRDSFAREAKVQGLKSRAAFKLLEIDARYRIFKRGQTVVDLGYAPGSWSQVAVERTKPGGRILGIDIIPAQPPKGVSTIQGNFLSAAVQESVKQFLLDPDRGRPRRPLFAEDTEEIEPELSYIELERHADDAPDPDAAGKIGSRAREEQEQGKMVDVVLSDMMMNTTGIKFSDHAGSMDLCAAALRFAFDTLRPGGHFVCKFYQGAEDKQLERQLKKLFGAVHREKPESSRSESKEAYFAMLIHNYEYELNDGALKFVGRVASWSHKLSH
ncbi:hypothetical protein EYC84_001647 [Monilinia fructicola]|uniref:rRNA methyltransferase 2, mitochondrial n=1 Tax=Monilinia fructicola TaxID=38448 RepID=A0A5M9JUU6_MONFR|nr:hypothetical protein EYC84_001647 [Monilinia fructicola]